MLSCCMIPHERLGELVTLLNYFYAATVWWLYKGYDGVVEGYQPDRLWHGE